MILHTPAKEGAERLHIKTLDNRLRKYKHFLISDNKLAVKHLENTYLLVQTIHWQQKQTKMVIGSQTTLIQS